MKRAFTFFIREEFEDKDSKVKTILFALCYFHSMMLERKKFGSKGFIMQYPFSIGDLRDSAIVLQNYLYQRVFYRAVLLLFLLWALVPYTDSL